MIKIELRRMICTRHGVETDLTLVRSGNQYMDMGEDQEGDPLGDTTSYVLTQSR